jgi:hypothetical protein
MKQGMLLVLTFCGVLLAGCGGGPMETAEQVETVAEAPAEEAAEAARHDVVYVCNCGPECTCGSVANTPGSCSCGEELAWAHLVKVEEHEALLCTCAEGCSCEIDPDDPSKCACGQPIRRVSLEGTGLYFCNCGGSCTCNYVADAPGQCSCGMELITAG